MSRPAGPRAVANVYVHDWDEDRDRAGFRVSFARLGERIGAERLGATVFELPPGQRSLYHCHHANEELALVLDGALVVRTSNDEQELRRGQAMLFPRGRGGAHACVNRSDRPVRYVVFSTTREPDVVEYPDGAKVGVFAGATPLVGKDAPLELFLDASATLDYYARETPPEA